MINTRTARYAVLALVAVAVGCSPDDYPTTPRFPVPAPVSLPDGELFFYEPPAGVSITSINVAGEMNGWDATATPMEQLSDGRWVAGITGMTPGSYQYKYVFNGDQWAQNMCDDATWGNPANSGKVDPDVETCVDDGNGGMNGIRVIPQPGHQFVYLVPDGVDVTSVTVPGSFNGWDNTQAPMDHVFTTTINLDPGTYQYKYFFNGTDWAGNMCNEPTYGDPNNGGMVDPDGTGCVAGGENAEITIDVAGPHTFRYIVPDGVNVTSVTVPGEFNGWDNTANAMDNTFTTTLILDPGDYEYKYFFNGTDWAGNMCNDGTWGDPNNGGKVDPNVEGCNGENATLTIQ